MQRRRGERETLSLAAAHRAGPLLHDAGEIVFVAEFTDAPATCGGIEPEDARHEFEVLAHREVVPQREALGHVAKAPAQLLRVARHLVPEHLDRPGTRLEQPAEHADRGRLPRAVRAEEAVDAGAWNREVDPIDGRDLAESARQPQRDDGRPGIHYGFDSVAGASSVTCTGTPTGSAAARGSSSVTSAA